MCPLLTAGLIKKQEAVEGVVDVSGGIEAMACQGEACALWVPIADEHGKAQGGNCAIPLTAVAMSQMNALAHSNQSHKKIVKG